MATPTNWPVPVGLGDWMRQSEKTGMHAARRPMIGKASDLVGPGIGAFAVEISDWNAEECRFNGFFYGPAGTPNSPWINGDHLGITVTTGEHGVQFLWSHQPALTADVETWVRSMHTHADALPAYGEWLALANTERQANVETGTVIAVAGPLPGPGTGPDFFAEYLWCDGAVYNATSYPALFDLFGNLFGGNGTTTFAVPDIDNLATNVRYAVKT